ncbi:MAG: rhodanese-related sulfurtransferase [Planctomycetota bacterium]
MDDLQVAALYKFVALPEFESLRQPLLETCRAHGIHGTLLLASEGINGTVAGTEKGIAALLEYLRKDLGLQDLEVKFSRASAPPFHRMKVRLKKEIVTMGVEGIDPNQVVGTYVAPEEWNALIERDDVWLVDTRNDYEVGIGTFRGATDPDIRTFREFPEWLRAQREQQKEPKVAMFCTGGIRCEKSTAFLKQEGVEDVFHLKGGILKYLENVPEEESLWEGECFVFDERVAVGHGLKEGSYGLCRACRFPISDEDRQAESFVEGISCARCVDQTTAEQKAGFAERHKQMLLAMERGACHLADG